MTPQGLPRHSRSQAHHRLPLSPPPAVMNPLPLLKSTAHSFCRQPCIVCQGLIAMMSSCNSDVDWPGKPPSRPINNAADDDMHDQSCCPTSAQPAALHSIKLMQSARIQCWTGLTSIAREAGGHSGGACLHVGVCHPGVIGTHLRLLHCHSREACAQQVTCSLAPAGFSI